MNGYFDFFDGIYLIHMPKDKHRMDNVNKIFGELGITTYNNVEPPLIEPTFLSCTKSHTSIYRDAIQRGYENIMIFEDDIVFNTSDDSIKKHIAVHMDYIRYWMSFNEWDVFYFDNILKNDHDVSNMLINQITRTTDVYTEAMTPIAQIDVKQNTHSYAVNKSAFQELLDIEQQIPAKDINQYFPMLKRNLKFVYNPGIFDQSLDIPSQNRAVYGDYYDDEYGREFKKRMMAEQNHK